MKRCHNCLCRTCLNSCKCQDCKGKIKECRRYSGFQQLSFFDPPEPEYGKAPRYSWDHYGITRERYRELTGYIRSGRYGSLARSAAREASKDISEYILLSVTEKLSYEGLQRLWDLKKIERMACCRTDFYGYRRLFYHIFNQKLGGSGNGNI